MSHPSYGPEINDLLHDRDEARRNYDILRAALRALEAELREDSEEWADRIMALLTEHGG